MWFLEFFEPIPEGVDVGDELLGVVVTYVFAQRVATAGERGAVAIGEREGGSPQLRAVGKRAPVVDAARTPREHVQVCEATRDLRELGERGVG
jgi:hypothetical protein